MADEKKIIDVEVREKGLDELNADLQKTEQSFKDVDKAADKTSKSVDDVAGNGGAIAILDSLTGGLATRMRDAYEASKLLNFSLKGMKTALIATGIGAFVVALGLIVAYWDDIVELIGGANKALERQIKLRGELIEELDSELTLLEAEEKLLKLQGKSTKEIKEQRREILKTQIEQGILQAAELKNQLEIETSKALEVTFAERLLAVAKGQLFVVGSINEEEQAGLDERKKAVNEILLATTNARIALFELNNPEGGGDAEGRGNLGKINPLTGESWQAQLDAEAEFMAEQFNLKENNSKELLKAQLATNKVFVKQAKKQSDVEIKIDNEKFMAKMDILGQFGMFLQNIGQENKALLVAGLVAEQIASISQIISSTGVANAKAVAASPLTLGQPWVTLNTISAGLSIAGGLAAASQAVRNINSEQPMAGSITTPSGGGVSAPAPPSIRQPDFNLVGQSGINQLADVIAEQERKPQRAYVVSEDIETNAELDRRIESSAAIG